MPRQRPHHLPPPPVRQLPAPYVPRPDPDASDDTPVLLTLGVKTRIIRGSGHPRQWILQRAKRGPGVKTTWRNAAYFGSRQAMIDYFGAGLAPELRSVLASLPEHVPQD